MNLTDEQKKIVLERELDVEAFRHREDKEMVEIQEKIQKLTEDRTEYLLQFCSEELK